MPSFPPVHRPYRSAPEVLIKSARDVDARRGSARARGYSREWDRAAKVHLRSNPLCVGCEAIGLTVPAKLVDHVDPHHGDMAIFWDRDRWQSACDWHHNVVKKRLEALRSRDELTVDDLWLNSAAAVAMTLAMRGRR